jgi:hypothetical protein
MSVDYVIAPSNLASIVVAGNNMTFPVRCN